MKRIHVHMISASIILGLIVLPNPNRARNLEATYARSLGVESAYVVRDAAERFAQVNSVYPTLASGLRSYLPGRRLLRNGVTGYPTNPIDGWATTPGSIGYDPVTGVGATVGYWVTLFGEDATVGPNRDGIVFQVGRVPPLELPE